MNTIKVYTSTRCAVSKIYRSEIKKYKHLAEIGRVKIINIDSYPREARDESIKAIPLTKVYRDNKLIGNFVGYTPELFDRLRGLNVES